MTTITHQVIYIKDDLIDIKGDYTTYSYTWGDLRYVYEPRIFDKKAKPYFSEGYCTVTFDPNGGTINGRDEWVIEIDYDYDNDRYNFDLADYVPEREGYTFLGWCTKPNPLYNSIVSETGPDTYGKWVSRSEDTTIYAMWDDIKHDEELERKGYKLTDNGELLVLSDDGWNAWLEKVGPDDIIKAKVKKISFVGGRDEAVTKSYFDLNNYKEFYKEYTTM